MFSDVIKAALEKEIAGQPRAVNSVVRGVTRAVSGLVPRDGVTCAYMFVGPSGTGKTHVVRTLARALHGDERNMAVVDCTQFFPGDPWLSFAGQITPLFTIPAPSGVFETAPLSIILVEYLERGPQELAKVLTAALETRQIGLSQGRRGSLRNCLVFLTSSLCAREILDEGRIGFSGTQEEEDEGDRVYKTCLGATQEKFGADLIGRLDGLIVFHRLEEEHLAEILERHVQRVNHWLAPRGFQYELLPEATKFLLERGRRNLRLGARDLVRAHRRFVEFPVADLMVSGRIPQGGVVRVDRMPDQDNLHFTMAEGNGNLPEPAGREVPVVWEEAVRRV